MMRFWWEGLRLGVSSLWAHKLRTSLTLLGHVMGVITVIVLVSLIQGLNHYVADKILIQGANLFRVHKIGMTTSYETYLERLKRPDLEMKDYEAVKEKNETLKSVGALLQGEARVKYRDKKLNHIPVLGLTHGGPFFDPYPVADGRAFREEDVTHRRRFVLLGNSVKNELFPVEDPIGKEIRVGSRRYTVIGVLGERGKVIGQDTDNFVAVPVTDMMAWHRDMTDFVILAQPAPDVLPEEAEAELKWILRGSRGLRPSQANNFEVITSDALMKVYQTLTGGIFAALVGVGSISLVVGGIVIMNIMLVSVTERTREIGVRKSVGARRRDVLIQFLQESVVLTVTGGLIGVLIGFALALLVSAVTPLPTRITPEATALGLGVSAVVGIFFGIFPAMRASRMDPVAALRYE
jgi:putative ABC transport system permease protein